MTETTKTKNETILINWNGTLFSENIYAWFQHGQLPVFSNNIEDLMLPDNYVLQKHASGAYELFAWDSVCEEHLYAGRLFAPKAVELM
jgi:hypothetical protein